MTNRPTGWNRFLSTLRREISAAALESYRRAGGPVFELQEWVENRRLECRIDGVDPWSVPPGTRQAWIAAWNAFVLQTLGSELLEGDYRQAPATAGFVPRSTAEQALSYFREVERWVNRAHQARANPEYRLDVEVPAPLPSWRPASPLSAAHVASLVAALRVIAHHTHEAMAFLLADSSLDETRRSQLNVLRQMHASAEARVRYVEDLAAGEPVPDIRSRAGVHALEAIAQLHTLGQLAADPERATVAPPLPPVPAAPVAAPGNAPPAASVAGRKKAPPARVRRHQDAAGRSIVEHADTIAFTGTLPGPATYQARIGQVRDGRSLRWRLDLRSSTTTNALGLKAAALSLRCDGGEPVTLRASWVSFTPPAAPPPPSRPFCRR
ncbi:hypothetical protein [Longimicrobium sp.]|jgi:hypothetical protein|uniref:hypothetical protein n=1 Tax=Longimicrobium sp. TaxID=2029185 RepID=UPI002EDA75F0